MAIARKLLTASLLALAWAMPATAQTTPVPDAKAAAAEPQLFAVIYREGPGWKAGQPMQKQALGEHLKYYRRGLDDGRVFAAGGLLAINGGLAILKMASLEDAQAFLAADPGVLNGTLVGEVHTWTTPFVSKKPLKP